MGSARFAELNPFYGKHHTEETKQLQKDNALKNTV